VSSEKESVTVWKTCSGSFVVVAVPSAAQNELLVGIFPPRLVLIGHHLMVFGDTSTTRVRQTHAGTMPQSTSLEHMPVCRLS